jgi:hypothetical protein
MRYRFRPSGKELIAGETVRSNQRGEYRLFDVEPAAWMLTVRKGLKAPAVTGTVHGALPEMDYVPTYHPGVRTAVEAETITVAPGAQLTGIDLRLRKVRVFHVRGRVTGAPAGVQPTVQDLDDSWTVHTKPEGTFDIAGFPAGRYRMAAEAGGGRSAVKEVTVANRDVDGVVFHIEPAINIEGTVEGIPNPEAVGIWTQPVGSSSEHRTAVRAGGGFTLPDLLPQPYRISARPPDGIYLKSIRFGPRDVSATGVIDITPGAGPLTLTVASDPGIVTGTAAAATPGDAPVHVVIAPTRTYEGRLDWIQYVQIDSPDGSFELDDVPPGDYRLLACETSDVDLAQSPEFRKAFEDRSEAITIHSKQKQSVRLKVIPAADVEEVRRRLR